MPVTLNGWKQIATFLNCGVKTAQRWEHRHGLPLHRSVKGARPVVFAYSSEIMLWQQMRSATGDILPMQARERSCALLERHLNLRTELRKLMDVNRQKMTELRIARKSWGGTRERRLQDERQQRAVEEARATISRRLIQAQEQERARIARELHDDISQRLALAIIAIDQLEQDPECVHSKLQVKMSQVRRQIAEIATDLQVLSHELHSSRLEILGIVPAMQGLCQDVSARKKIEIEFKSSSVPQSLSPEVALCLFRVLQEGLRNAIKHSQAKHIHVRLGGTRREVHLVIHDSGIGFDVRTASASGLGLTSMRERVRLARGTLLVKSAPMKGTTIHVCIPPTAKDVATLQTQPGDSVQTLSSSNGTHRTSSPTADAPANARSLRPAEQRAG